MKSWLYPLFSLLICLASVPVFAQQGWPKLITTSTGTEIRVFEFQPQSLEGNKLVLQSAVSLKESGSSDPVFGMMWADAVIAKDQSGNISHLNSISIQKLKVPGVTQEAEVEELKELIETELPKHQLGMTVNDLQNQLAATQKQAKLSEGINTKAPKIIYSKKPSILVYIDGQPQIQSNPDWKVDQVVNTPFTIIKSNDQFFLYGNKKWFTASSINGPWNYIMRVPNSLSSIDQEVRKADTTVTADQTIPEVFVTTEPAELIQSKGEPNFAAVQGTNLLYMTNTNNDIFLDINSQQYYVLISGRWYKAKNLTSNWTYIPSNSLPEDFVKIPEGSAKDAVLASIAGTPAAEESLLEAQVPQTAKVDRNTATAQVDYDGEPQFENIEGTDLQYAVNTPGAVINDGRKYYYVENGVWFESNSANGPWKVATERPDEVENIPPTSPVYNVKYVYIYDATPEYVYMGYTPGYLGTYIYGPTVVYGTGYYYRPWRGRYYYARPLTWGFNMRYNPWSGWSFGISYGRGWFYSEYDRYYSSYNRAYYGGCWGGWWGPTVYRPQYSRGYGNYYGGNTYVNNIYINRSNRANNIYRYRRDVVTYDRQRNEGSRYNRNSGSYANNNDRNNSRPDRNENISQRPTQNQNNTDRTNRFGGTPTRRFGNLNNPNGNNERISRGAEGNSGIGNTNTSGRFGSNRGMENVRGTNMGNPNTDGGIQRLPGNTNSNNGNTEFRRSRIEGNQAEAQQNQPNEMPGNRRRDFNTLPQTSNANGNVNSGNEPNRDNENFRRAREISRPTPSSNTPVQTEPQREVRQRVNINQDNQSSAPVNQPQRVYTPQRREISSDQQPVRTVQPQPERRFEAQPERRVQPQPERRMEPQPERRVEAQPERRVEAQPERRVESPAGRGQGPEPVMRRSRN